MKPVTVRFIGDAEKALEELNKIVGDEQERGVDHSEHQQLFRSIKRTSDLIKDNPFYGAQIKKKQILPKYPVDNLWKADLTGFWRLLYTIKGDNRDNSFCVGHS